MGGEDGGGVWWGGPKQGERYRMYHCPVWIILSTTLYRNKSMLKLQLLNPSRLSL
jgi:hypothetical protein